MHLGLMKFNTYIHTYVHIFQLKIVIVGFCHLGHTVYPTFEDSVLLGYDDISPGNQMPVV